MSSADTPAPEPAASLGEAGLRQALEAAETGTWWIDLTTYAVHWDLLQHRLHGMAPGTFPGTLRAGLEVVEPEDRPQAEAIVRNARESNQPFRCTVRVRRRDDGRLRWLVYVGGTSFDAAGQPVRMTGVTVDVTEYRAAEEEARFRTRILDGILHYLPVILAVYDEDERLVEIRGQVLRALGVEDNALVGYRLTELFPNIAHPIRQTLQGETTEFIEELVNGDKAVWLHHYGFFDPVRRHGIGFGFDVTEQRRLAEERAQAAVLQQQAIANTVVAVQEQERKRMAASLHDGLGQILYAASLNLERVPQSPQRDTVLNLLQEAVRKTRTMAFELMPGVLADFGLEIALRELGKRLGQPGISFEFTFGGPARRFAPDLEITLYRITQELINNVLRHAHATRATISVKYRSDGINLCVEDNGQGLPTTAEPTGGTGLASIRARVGLLGGTFTLKPAPKGGTRAEVDVPL